MTQQETSEFVSELRQAFSSVQAGWTVNMHILNRGQIDACPTSASRLVQLCHNMLG